MAGMATLRLDETWFSIASLHAVPQLRLLLVTVGNAH